MKTTQNGGWFTRVNGILTTLVINSLAFALTVVIILSWLISDPIFRLLDYLFGVKRAAGKTHCQVRIMSSGKSIA